jgi:transcriptional regulator with XRE-family HTH domain
MLRNWLVALTRAELARRGMTQYELAVKAGMSPKHVSGVLSGSVNASVDKWGDILRAIGIELDVEMI